MIHYYVDPGPGFVFVQNTAFLWGILLGILGGLFFLFKLFFNFFRKFLWVIFILLLILIIGGIMIHRPLDRRKVIVLGIDAMDPNITEKLMFEGKLPNFSLLKTKGSYARLETTIPSESVVAWTSFSTGLNPGGHGIFDFIMRDPKNYLPYLSLNEISSEKGKVKIQIRRKGKTFWNILSTNKVPSFIYFCPNTFPAEKISGKMLSGMGVPDITGTMGKFSFYTTKELTKIDKESRGRIIKVKLDNNTISTEIYGPKVSLNTSQVETSVPLNITINKKERGIKTYFQKSSFSLNEKRWSDWQRVSFKIAPFKNICGIVRFYLKSIDPEFELYVSPVNFSPQRPPFSISYPFNYSKRLTKKVGFYYTQGMPHDTWALTEDRLDEKAFLEHADGILNEKISILREGLRQFKSGLFFFYFDTLDMIQHMFWRYIDPQHILFEPGSPYENTIYKYYEKIDKIAGEILESLDENTTLIVLSDHGFNSFRYAVNLNRWLLENGYLFLKEGETESKEFFENVDWSKTKAYALGFGGIYINKIGREYYGIVDESETEMVKQEIIRELKELRNPNAPGLVINNVYDAQKIFNGPHLNDAPDLFVGFNAGYRASWQTALGGQASILIEENKRKWSGDHLIDPVLVPGVIFVNKKIDLNNPSIVDIASTILDLFGIDKPSRMQGRVLFKNGTK